MTALPPTVMATSKGKVPTGGAVLSGTLIGPRPVAHIVTTCPGLAVLVVVLIGCTVWETKF